MRVQHARRTKGTRHVGGKSERPASVSSCARHTSKVHVVSTRGVQQHIDVPSPIATKSEKRCTRHNCVCMRTPREDLCARLAFEHAPMPVLSRQVCITADTYFPPALPSWHVLISQNCAASAAWRRLHLIDAPGLGARARRAIRCGVRLLRVLAPDQSC